jgi:hypothetical protein
VQHEVKLTSRLHARVFVTLSLYVVRSLALSLRVHASVACFSCMCLVLVLNAAGRSAGGVCQSAAVEVVAPVGGHLTGMTIIADQVTVSGNRGEYLSLDSSFLVTDSTSASHSSSAM